MNDIKINTKQAINSLFETNLIKVLVEIDDVRGLATRYFPRDQIVKIISENTCEFTGNEAVKKGFGMSLENDGKVMFIESKI